MEYKIPIERRLLTSGQNYYECAKCGNSLGQHYHYYCPYCGVHIRLTAQERQALKIALESLAKALEERRI